MLTFVIWFSSMNVGAKKTLLCDYKNWASNKSGDTTDDIEPNLCTHLVYYNVELNIELSKLNRQFMDDKKLIRLKKQNHQLKVLIDLNVKPNNWIDIHLELMNNRSHVKLNVEKVLNFLRQHKFDGLVLKFFPNNKEKIGFMNLISVMKKVFQPHSLLLAVTGHYYESLINEGYDIPILKTDVDLLILPAYNFYNPKKYPNMADHHTPLYRPSWAKENYHTNVDFVVNHWINKGFPREKILLGISLYGRSWTLSSNKTTPPAPAFGPDQPGKYTDGSGEMTYYEICQAVKFEGWQVFQDRNKRMGPYAVSPGNPNRTWVGYDDPAMTVIKSKYILLNGLGGAAIWNVSNDDYDNRCGDGHNPMLTAIRNTLMADFSVISTNSPVVKLADFENLLYRQKVAFVFCLVVSISSCITIIYVLSMIFKNAI